MLGCSSTHNTNINDRPGSPAGLPGAAEGAPPAEGAPSAAASAGGEVAAAPLRAHLRT